MPEMLVSMRHWRRLCVPILVLLGTGLRPTLASAESAPAPIQWRTQRADLWQLETTLRTATPATEVVSRILTASAYAERTGGQLSAAITRADGQRYLVELHERRVGIPNSINTDSSLELTPVGSARVEFRVVAGPYAGLHGAWHVSTQAGGLTAVRGLFELQPSAATMAQAPFAALLQQQDPRPIVEGLLQLWVQALGLPLN